jgi:hypothetical protein
MELMAKEKISDEDWVAFCEQFIDSFADDVSLLAKKYWLERTIYARDEA